MRALRIDVSFSNKMLFIRRCDSFAPPSGPSEEWADLCRSEAIRPISDAMTDGGTLSG